MKQLITAANSDYSLPADQFIEAKSIALNALAPRARSRTELHKHLKKRGVYEAMATAVLDSLELEGLINDLEFAKAWSESRQRQKKLSKRVIAQELRMKGVSQDIIDETISGIDEETEYKMAYELAQRKYRACSHLDSDVIYRRVHSILSRKGFDHDLTNRILRELLSA